MTGEMISGRAELSVMEAAKPLMTPQVGGIEQSADALANQAEVRRSVREV